MRNSLNPHPWPAILSESSELQENTANDANSAPSTPTSGKSCEICDICTQQSRKVTYLYTHVYDILHYCRLVLDAYNFTIPTVFYIEIYVCFIQYQCFQDQLHSLTPITYQNQNSQRCRYTRLYPVSCQLIVLNSNILILA